MAMLPLSAVNEMLMRVVLMQKAPQEKVINLNEQMNVSQDTAPPPTPAIPPVQATQGATMDVHV